MIYVDYRNGPQVRLYVGTEKEIELLEWLVNWFDDDGFLNDEGFQYFEKVLEQRIGRIYRMGQKENITVINMVSVETIEHRMLSVLEFKASMAQGVLDPDGDDTIFMSESKFKKFMENVEALTGQGVQESEQILATAGMDDDETEDYEHPATSAQPLEQEAVADSYSGDDDVPMQGKSAGSPDTEMPAYRRARRTDTGSRKGNPASSAPATPQELIRSGVSFFTGLSQTLSDPVKTQELVASIVATDEQTGQAYLKIPVESAAVVENAVKLLGGLLSGLGK